MIDFTKKLTLVIIANALCALITLAIASMLLCAPVALASPLTMVRSMATGVLHVWSTGDRPRATDLNGNFTFLNTVKVGGGVQLTNADVASAAAIAHSKMATPALLPKAWAVLSANCTGSAAVGTACTVGDSSGVTSITANNSSGQFRVNLSYTPANVNYAVFVTSRTAASVCISSTPYATTAPHIIVQCFDYTGAANDVNQFQVLVMDS